MNLTERQKQILLIVARYTDCSLEDIFGSSKKAKCVVAKHLAMYFLRERLGMTYTGIGRIITCGEKRSHHTTVIHGYRSVVTKLEVGDALITAPYYLIKAELGDEPEPPTHQPRMVIYYPESFKIHEVIPILNKKCNNLKYEFL